MRSLKDCLEELAVAAKAGRRRVKRQTATHVLRESFDDIEKALEAGVSHQAMLEVLQGQGLKLTLNGFRTALYRLREERQQSKAADDLPAQPITKDETPQQSDKAGIRLSPSYMGGGKSPPPAGKEIEALRSKPVDLNSFSSKFKKEK